MALDIPNIAPANPWSDVVDVQNHLTDKALAQEKERIANKFAPLDRGIKLQNALSYNNRMGNIGLYLRGISQMPAAERQAYLADPANRQNYMTMLEQFRGGMNNPQASGNVLTPEFMQKFGFGGGQQQNEPTSPFEKLVSYFTGGGGQNSLQQPMPSPKTQSASQRITGQEFNENINPIEPVITQNSEQQPIGSSQNVSPVQTELTQKDRNDLGAKLRANNAAVGSDIKNRAEAAIAFEKFLKLQRKQIGKVFDDAFKYSQIYGRGKEWLDKFKRNQPKEYANFIKARNSLIPLMSNGIRFLERMGVSHEAQEDAKNQVAGALQSIDVSPNVAREVFNDHMRALADISEGVLTAAEPIHPGVRMKLAGLEHFKGNYIPMRIEVINSKGEHGTIPEDQWEKAKAKGYKKV